MAVWLWATMCSVPRRSNPVLPFGGARARREPDARYAAPTEQDEAVPENFVASEPARPITHCSHQPKEHRWSYCFRHLVGPTQRFHG